MEYRGWEWSYRNRRDVASSTSGLSQNRLVYLCFSESWNLELVKYLEVIHRSGKAPALISTTAIAEEAACCSLMSLQ